MNETIRVLDIDIDDYTAKRAFKETVHYLETEPLSVIEMVTADTLMYAKEDMGLKENLGKCDMVLPGEKEILEAAHITDRRQIQEVETRTYLKLLLRYLHKNHVRVYLLVDTEQDAEELYEYLEQAYSGIQIVGIAKVSASDRADDMVVNAVNGGEADCVLAAMSAPVQEEFVVKNRSLINARVWLGAGKAVKPFYKTENRRGRLMQFMIHSIFKREIAKKQRELQIQGLK